jgi:hypothetical protein
LVESGLGTTSRLSGELGGFERVSSEGHRF